MRFKNTLTAVAVFFAGSVALAMPAVGDYTSFDLTVGAVAGTYEVELTAFDSATDQFVQKVTVTGTTANGQPVHQAQESFIQRSKLVTDAQVTDALSNCAAYGGTSETLTVPAGTFETCKLPTSNNTGHVWVGQVPFGIVQQIGTSNGQPMTARLKSFRAGQ